MNTQQRIREFQEEGWAVRKTQQGHLRLTHPKVPRPVFFPKRSGGWRAERNDRALLMRMVTQQGGK